MRTDAGTLLVLDCGTGIHELGQVLVARATGPVDGHLLIGHTHWDHIQGLPFFAPLFDERNDWHVYGPRGLDTSIDHTLAGQMQYTYFPVQLLDFARRRSTTTTSSRVSSRSTTSPSRTRYLNHPALTLGYRIEADGASLVYATDHEPSTSARAATGLDREDALHVGFVARRRPAHPRRAVPRRGVPDEGGVGSQHGRVRGRRRRRRRASLGSPSSTTIRRAPTTRVDVLVDRAPASAPRRQFAGEVFAAAEGTTIALRSDRDRDARGSRSETATRAPALAELNRAVAIAVTDPGIEVALLEAAAAEGFEALVCRDLDEVLDTVARRGARPIVVLEAASDRGRSTSWPPTPAPCSRTRPTV